MQNSHRRTPQECVDRNAAAATAKKQAEVALHRSAWIEICVAINFSLALESHSTGVRG